MKMKLIGLAVVTLLTPLASANEASWLELDQDISTLAATSSVGSSGASISGFIQSSYKSDSENDKGEWDFSGVRINVKSNVEDIALKISFDLKSGSLSLKDAFARWDATESMSVTWGKFKRPFLHSFLTSANKRLFVGSTANAANDARAHGVMLNGDLSDMGTWQVAATNGEDPATDDMHYTARVAFDLVGEGGFNAFEGARGDAAGTNLSLGVSYAEENAPDLEHHKVGIELAGNVDAISFHLDMVMYSDDSSAPLDKTFSVEEVTGPPLEAAKGGLADTSPLGLTLAYMLADDMEIAVRHEDFDDDFDTTRLTVGFNYYAIAPNSVVWQLNYSDSSSDFEEFETELIQIGLLASF
ncbi:MAG: porin [Planctomycetota bacterium]|nr:porin [Planctomycetota bacterium]